ncbi:MAG: YibE/F family protein [Candidatus Taylorbacteria bacterium]|nr:YibE/F family protein [Candidatus Taylorbacteria bacterium]
MLLNCLGYAQSVFQRVKNSMKKLLTIAYIFLISLLVPVSVQAQVVLEDKITTSLAQIVETEKAPDETLPGSDKVVPTQKIKAKVLEGEDTGKTIEFVNDFVQLKEGDLFYLRKFEYVSDGKTVYSLADPYRLTPIYWLFAIFIFITTMFGGRQGVRGLISLACSLFLIIYILLPGILEGYSPILISILVSALIIILGSYITHGFNKTTTAAVVGMIVTVIFVGVLAQYSVEATQLTGFDSEESVYLNINTRGQLDLSGLLLGGMLIGLLGVLYDAAIGQAVAVEELHKIAPHVSRLSIYKRAIRIGREHIGALVDTLAIAYVGASLPLLLLFSMHDTPILQLINRENFATEIVRTIVGSIGLILAVPITTYISTLILVKPHRHGVSVEKMKKEEEEMEHFHHAH